MLYIFEGDYSVRINDEVYHLTESLKDSLAEDKLSFSYIVTTDLESLTYLNSYPLAFSKEIIVLHFPLEGDVKQLLDVVRSHIDDTYYLIVVVSSLDKRKQEVKELISLAHRHHEYKVPNEYEKKKLEYEYDLAATKYGFTLTEDQRTFLLQEFGGDLNQLHSVLQLLKESDSSIHEFLVARYEATFDSSEDVETDVSSMDISCDFSFSLDSPDVFTLFDALLGRRLEDACTHFDYLINSSHLSPVSVLQILLSQYQAYISVKEDFNLSKSIKESRKYYIQKDIFSCNLTTDFLTESAMVIVEYLSGLMLGLDVPDPHSIFLLICSLD